MAKKHVIKRPALLAVFLFYFELSGTVLKMNIRNFKNFLLLIGISATGLTAALFGHTTGLIVCVCSMILAAILENKVLLLRLTGPALAAQPAYDLIFQHMPCIAKVISPKLDLLMINKETTRLTGINLKGAIGKKCYDVFGHNEPCANCPVLKAIQTKKICTASDQNRIFNTKELYVNQTAMPILDKKGSVQYILEMSVDITERKKLKQMNHHILIETVSSLTELIDSRDHSTGMHSKRVRQIALLIGQQLQLPEEDLEDLSIAAILHDIGKIGIPGHILLKTGKLSPQEYEIIQQHTDIGYDALKNITQMQKIATYVRFHHEAVDGSGYPCHLSGREIPLISKILSVADVYEALTANRVYRQAMNQEAALKILREGTGVKFDPAVLEAFFTCVNKGLIFPHSHAILSKQQVS